MRWPSHHHHSRTIGLHFVLLHISKILFVFYIIYVLWEKKEWSSGALMPAYVWIFDAGKLLVSTGVTCYIGLYFSLSTKNFIWMEINNAIAIASLYFFVICSTLCFYISISFWITNNTTHKYAKEERKKETETKINFFFLFGSLQYAFSF